MVSVLIPNYNNARWLRQCLESCIAQGELLYEIIVVDDHSTDSSLKLLREISAQNPKKINVYTNPNKGANSARNYAFSKSSGKFIQWLDSDDFLLPGKFDAQVKILEEECDIAYSDWRMDFWIDSKKVNSERKKYKAYQDFLLELLKDNWNASHSYLIKKSFAKKLDCGIGWNPETKVGQDREYFTMAGILGARFKYVAGVFAVYNSQDKGTIAGMDFHKRLVENQQLEMRFKSEIIRSQNIKEKKKSTYTKVLNTHKIKACYYSNNIIIEQPFSLFDIQWKMMHYKMRLPVFLLYFIKHMEYYLKK